MWQRFAWLALACTAASCGRINYDGLWDRVFIVSTVEDRLAGPDTIASRFDLDPGTNGLSLREALTMANNSEGSNLIIFDSEVFADGGEAAIVLSTALPTLADEFTSVDASGRGVQIVASDAGAFRVEANNTSIGGINFVSTGATAVIAIEAASAVDICDNYFQTASTAIDATNANELSITGNEFRESIGDAIVVDTATNLVVLGNHFEDLEDRALRVANIETAAIDDNTLLHVGGTQMTIADSTLVAVNRNNIVIDNKTSQKGVRFERVTDSRICDNFIDPGTAHMVSLDDSSDNIIEGNILDRGHAGVVLEGESARNMVFRNIIIESEYDGVYVSSTSDDNIVVHNTIHNASTALVFSSDTVTEGNNLITNDTDEGFVGYVDVANYDYRLVPDSPHIDAGEELGYDCVPGSGELYWDAAPDLGAVETRR